MENFLLESLLPHLRELSPAWDSMEAGDFVTSYPSINQVYCCVRGQFANKDTLKKHVQTHIEEFGEDDEQSQDLQ